MQPPPSAVALNVTAFWSPLAPATHNGPHSVLSTVTASVTALPPSLRSRIPPPWPQPQVATLPRLFVSLSCSSLSALLAAQCYPLLGAVKFWKSLLEQRNTKQIFKKLINEVATRKEPENSNQHWRCGSIQRKSNLRHRKQFNGSCGDRVTCLLQLSSLAFCNQPKLISLFKFCFGLSV